jgi:glucose/arabinose dehydrogenase
VPGSRANVKSAVIRTPISPKASLRKRAAALLTTLATLAIVLASPALPASPVRAGTALPLTLVQGGLTQPILVANAGDARLFVAQQNGIIRIVGGGTFLDISSRISTGGERGLLALAFHPNYGSNGLFYVDYTRASDGDLVIAEYRRSTGDPNAADPNSERILITIEHSSAGNHNGGTLMFKNGLLYITTGDGGGDPGTRAQSLSSLLGKILRIDPMDPDGAGPRQYSVPGTNPYVGRKGLDEIWSRGLRNPWRCSFDRATGKLFCGDVGQNLYEEVDRHKSGKGVNFGWQLLEGFHYYRFPNRNQGDMCTSSCRTLPIAEYSHDAFGGGNSNVTGGYVSRRAGAAMYGQYIFGDFGSGRVWAIPNNFTRGTPLPNPIFDTPYLISSFGEDVDGHVYLVDYNGAVYLLNNS